jgi:hypothetical protein
MAFFVADTFHQDPMVIEAGPRAAGLWVQAGSWSAKYRTNGHVPSVIAHHIGTSRLAHRLVEVGLWTEVLDGYLFGPLCKFTAPDGGRRRIPDELRQRVYARDGFACLHCGSAEYLSLDHIHPHSRGGKDTFENLQTLCTPCNSSKGATV